MVFASYNQEIISLDELKIPVFDRSFFFGDAVYEVIRVYQKKPFLIASHLNRLANSLKEMSIENVPDLRNDIYQNISLNDISEGMVYIQISRGSLPRSHSFHNLSLKPNVLIYSTPFFSHPAEKEASTGTYAITHEDIRWHRCDIKSVNLLANCLVQTKAQQAGAKEAILIRNNQVTEGSSSNVFIVKNGVIKTPALSSFILPGTRRQFLVNFFKTHEYIVLETTIKKSELYEADEVFITSSIKEAIAIVAIDGHNIGHGQVGPIALLARQAILEAADQAAQD
jgi:D-alanine transaminase